MRFANIWEWEEPQRRIVFDIMVSSYFKGSSNEKQSLPSHFLSAVWHKYTLLNLIIQHDPQWNTASFLIYMSKRSITSPGHCHHNEILSTCQDAAKVPNKCVAKLSICGFLGVALAANGLSVRALVQTALRFVCCWFFLETCGFVTSAAIHWATVCCCSASYYPELRRIVFGNRMLTFSYGTNLQLGASAALFEWWANFVSSSSSHYGY